MLLAVIAAGGYLIFAPSDEAPPEPPPVKVDVSDWEGIKSNIEQMDKSVIRRHGEEFSSINDPDKAFLMYKRAAKKGDGAAAMAIGVMYDPATFAAVGFDAGQTPFSKPNPRKALQWYDRALENGEAKAQPLRDKLVAQLREQADAGDAAAAKILARMKRK